VCGAKTSCEPSKEKLRRRAAIIGSLVFAGLASACVSNQGQKGAMVLGLEVHREYVRRVDFSQAPEMEELAERVRQIGNEVYPKILSLLMEDTSKAPRQFDIVFKKRLKANEPGYTLNRKIKLDAGWFAKHPAHLDMVLIHEMAHVPQDQRWYKAISSKSRCWFEGVADFVPYKLGYTNGWRCPQCAAEFLHYTHGYRCAGAFLLFVDATYGTNVVSQLNTELRRRTYSDKFFAKATGKSLDALWVEFQNTPAFTPLAAEVDKLYNALGYLNGQPPKDVVLRFRSYLTQQGQVDELHFLADELKAKPPPDVLRLHAFHQYVRQPAEFLIGLWGKDQLPGFSAGEVDGISFRAFMAPGECESWVHPLSRTLTCSKKGDTYYYLTIQGSESSAWKLQKAWRTDSNERVIEEYAIP
jgi:hypothetical protein